MKLFGRTDEAPLWRDEFSIHQGDERYVSRRQFAKFLVLTSLGMFVGNVWIQLKSMWHRAPTFLPRSLGRADDVPVDGVKLFAFPTDDDPCILVRLAPDRFAAYSQKCTHLSCAVYYSAERHRIECPCHQGYFSPEDGSVLQGPPPRPLPRVVLERRGADLVAVGMQEGPAADHRAVAQACATCPRSGRL